jgi:hypothetical protein
VFRPGVLDRRHAQRFELGAVFAADRSFRALDPPRPEGRNGAVAQSV